MKYLIKLKKFLIFTVKKKEIKKSKKFFILIVKKSNFNGDAISSFYLSNVTDKNISIS